MASPRLLAILGSGETAPPLVKAHRSIFERVGAAPAVILDTPYGFQENADDISARAVEYFANSVGRAVEVAEFRAADADAVTREAALTKVAGAGWVFAGPGSPTYALRQWAGSEMPALLGDKLVHGGAIVFASAAALTLGRYSVPVYEIYKSGEDPQWAEGLDLLGALGPDLAVIPHYDNAEGGGHDTRYCYLGERRLRLLESQLPPTGWVLGVDEHTAAVIDLDAGVVEVVGVGGVTIRRQGRSVVWPAGTSLPLDALADPGLGKGPGASHALESVFPPAVAAGDTPADATVLHGAIRLGEATFDAAMSGAEIESAVRAALDLDQTLADWAGDTTESDAADRGRAALRRMIVRLGSLAEVGGRDPRLAVAPYVDALIAERSAARADRRFSDADRIRDRLTAAGVEVRDTASGTAWELRPLG